MGCDESQASQEEPWEVISRGMVLVCMHLAGMCESWRVVAQVLHCEDDAVEVGEIPQMLLLREGRPYQGL